MLVLAWKSASYSITSFCVTHCNYARDKVSPPLWQSVTNVITILKHAKFYYQKLLQLPKSPQIMNSQTTIHGHYSFSNLLKTNMIDQIMNRWIVFLSFLEINFKILFSLTSMGFSGLNDRVTFTSHLLPLTSGKWACDMRNFNDLLYKITSARDFCCKLFGSFAKNPYFCTQNVLKLGRRNE